MQFEAAPIEGVFLLRQQRICDDRGWFARVYCQRELAEFGLVDSFVQTNHSFSEMEGTLRGLHYQVPPHAEAKLVRCTSGAVFDVVVDLRKNSPTFLDWFGVDLTDSNEVLLYCPPGFAHGYQTLTDRAEVTYQSSAFYAPDFELQIRYNDPRIGIDWPINKAIVSEKDASAEVIEKDYEGIFL